MDTFSPGEKLDDGITQELQPLVVIDPGMGGGNEGGGGKRARFKVRGRISEEDDNQQMNQPQNEIAVGGAYLEGEGSSWPRRDMMLISVLIPVKRRRSQGGVGGGQRDRNVSPFFLMYMWWTFLSPYLGWRIPQLDSELRAWSGFMPKLR